jgi:hypothetical protein
MRDVPIKSCMDDLISSVLLVNEKQKHYQEMNNALEDKNKKFQLLQIS